MADPTPLAIIASSGAVSELVGIVQKLRAGLPRYTVTALVGEGALLAEIAGRLAVPLLDDRALRVFAPGTHVAITVGDHALH